MYLYLGQDTVINSDSVIGVFDLDNTTISKITKKFLNKLQKDDDIITVNEELPKSFVVCSENKKTSVYLLQIAPSTLKKRADNLRAFKQD